MMKTTWIALALALPGQAREGLEARAAVPSKGLDLDVSIRTLTPNFKTFRRRVDGKEWADSSNAFPWKLHAGANRLEAMSVNAFGVHGPASAVEIDVP